MDFTDQKSSCRSLKKKKKGVLKISNDTRCWNMKKADCKLKVSPWHPQVVKLVYFPIQGNTNSGRMHPKLLIEFISRENKWVIVIFFYLLVFSNMSTMNMNYFGNKKKKVWLKKILCKSWQLTRLTDLSLLRPRWPKFTLFPCPSVLFFFQQNSMPI